jgi:hypothetical protein
MSQVAETLTQPAVARLLGMVAHEVVRELLVTIAEEVRHGRLQWETFQGRPCEFGPSLATQARRGSRLSTRQINAAKGKLLQRNWTQVRHVIQHDKVSLSDSLLETAKGSSAPAPTYRRSGASNGSGAAPATSTPRTRRGRRRASRATPQPVASTRTCGKTLAYSRDKCTRTGGHPGACIGDARTNRQAPTQDVDSVLAGRTVMATPAPTRTPTVEPADAQVARFIRVAEAMDPKTPEGWKPTPEPEVEGFRRLMLD